MQCIYNSFIQIIHFHGLFCNALRCRKLVPVEYWCSYGTVHVHEDKTYNKKFSFQIIAKHAVSHEMQINTLRN